MKQYTGLGIDPQRRTRLDNTPKGPTFPIILGIVVFCALVIFGLSKLHLPKDVQAASDPKVTTSDCLPIDTVLNTTSNDWEIMSPISVGHCYILDKEDKQAFADLQHNVATYPQIIKKIMGDSHLLTATEVDQALKDCLKTGVLNLIK